MTVIKNEISRQFDGIAHVYPEVKEKNCLYYHYLVRAIQDKIKSPHSPILEIGCGHGGILNKVSTVPGVGVDFSEKMVKEATKRYKSHRFYCQNLGNIRLNEKFQTILLPDVVEYIDDLNKAFANIAELLESRGTFIVTTPNPSWNWILKLATKFKLKMDDQYSKPPSKNKIIQAAETNNIFLKNFSTELLIPKKMLGSEWINKVMKGFSTLYDKGIIMVIVFEKN